MKLLNMTEINIQYQDLLTHKFKKPVKPPQQRSKGVHLSDILRYLHFGSLPPALDDKTKKAEMLNATLELDDPTVMNLRMVLGMAWESFIVGFMPDVAWQPKELVLNGIAGSMDAFEWADYDDVPVIHEFKYTHKSCRERLGPKILEDTLWMWQIKGYAQMYHITQNGSGFTPQAQLHVCYGNGDYNQPFRERYIKYLIEFDPEELESFWQRAILPNKQKAMAWKREQEEALNA